MRTEDFKTIATVALSTTALTVITFWSVPLEAGNEGDALGSKITKPKLVAHGIEVTLAAAEGRIFRAGEVPKFQLKALNSTSEPATMDLCIAMNASAPANANSRVLRMPAEIWQQQQTLTLKPNETKGITLPVETKLPANSVIAVTIQESSPTQMKAVKVGLDVSPALSFANASHPGVVAMNFSTAVSLAQVTPGN